jgi:hypothetical protein
MSEFVTKEEFDKKVESLQNQIISLTAQLGIVNAVAFSNLSSQGDVEKTISVLEKWK